MIRILLFFMNVRKLIEESKFYTNRFAIRS